MTRVRSIFWRVVALAILAAGAYATWVRFSQGLGASTNLTDRFPWGIWIGFDILCGVGLAAGGFTITSAVYILHPRVLSNIQNGDSKDIFQFALLFWPF
jgi:Ni/Fe-hydrogenase subunit HybB-like protein